MTITAASKLLRSIPQRRNSRRHIIRIAEMIRRSPEKMWGSQKAMDLIHSFVGRRAEDPAGFRGVYRYVAER